MERRVGKAEQEKTLLLEENHQLKLKMKEFLSVYTEGAKGKDAKVKVQLETLMKSAQMLEKDNLKLRGELKSSLQEKLDLIQKIDKYDKIVDELKNYNLELI